MSQTIKDAGLFILTEFIPFRLNRMADAVSENLAQIYRRQFDLEIPEWRVLVTVGPRTDCTAQQIAASTRMHKTRVSRAVASLESRGLLERDFNHADAREFRLCLSKEGRRLYALLVPQALRRETEILACLTAAEQRSFRSALTRLEQALGVQTE